MSSRPVVEIAGVRTSVGFSAGYVHEKLDASHRLRELFAAADERMYQVKQSHRLSALSRAGTKTGAAPVQAPYRE